jgi:hypothetical protein
MEKIEYRYRFWYRYRPKFVVSDWYRIETKKAGIAHHYAKMATQEEMSRYFWSASTNCPPVAVDDSAFLTKRRSKSKRLGTRLLYPSSARMFLVPQNFFSSHSKKKYKIFEFL